MKKHSNNGSNREFQSDILAVGGMFILWRVTLFMIEKIAPILWPLREDFLGLVTPWANFDGAHYTSIAKGGYGVFQFAFFPLYSLLIRAFVYITKLPYESAAVGVSQLAFFIGFFLYWRYLKGSKNRIWTVAFLLIYPASFFFAAAYSESVFFAFAVGVLLAIKNKRWLLAGAFVALSGATRLVGIFLWLLLAIAMWQHYHRLRPVDWLALVIGPTGLVAYMVYLWNVGGDPFAFFHVQPAFGAGRSGSELIFLPQVLWRYTRIFLTVPTGDLLYHVAVFEFITFILGVILLVAAWKKRYAPGLLLYSACVLFLPSLTGTLSSMPRYLLAAFPLFSVLGEIRSSWIKSVILIVFITLLMYATTGFLRGYFVS